MRKRELLLIAAFAVMGVIAYQLTAAPAPDGRQRFSLSTLIDEIRRETGGGAMAAVTSDGTIALEPAVLEARISSVPHVVVRGAPRADIAYTLKVEANGPDEATAREHAGRARLSEDRLGDVLWLRVNAPRDGRQVASLTLTVPARLRLQVEGAQGGATLDAADIAGIQLDGVVGDVRLARIGEVVVGSHRNGAIRVVDAGTVDLLLQNSHTTIEQARGSVRLSTRNGQNVIADAAGPIELTAQNDETVVRRPRGAVRATGVGGSIEIDRPEDQGYVDMRRTAVTLTLSREAAWTILTTDEPLRVHLVGPPAIRLDAIATDGGTIAAESLDASPLTIEQEMRLTHTIGAGAVAVALRNRRGVIVIGGTK